jgi:cytoskeleton protein RodZ
VGELGKRLREAREGRGLSLVQVQAATRIRRTFLEALEEEHFDQLPGDVYARGFIRNYARFLGLDPEETLQAYKIAAGKPIRANTPQILSEPLARPASHVWLSVLAGVAIVLLLALGGWYGYSRLYLGMAPWPIFNLPLIPAATATREATPTQVIVATQTLEPTSTQVIQSTPPTATPDIVQGNTTTPTFEKATATVMPTTTLTPTKIIGIVIDGKVTATTYVEVTADGERVFTGTLEPGNARVWTAQREIRFLVGNADGLKLVVNDVEAPALGKSGEVVTVVYNLDNLPRR